MIKILDKNFKNIDVEKKPKEKFMPERGTLSIKKAKDLLNYQPSNPIEIGYQKYISWYKEFLIKIIRYKCLKKPFIIAEIGNNHEGSFSMAQKLILKAAECGVDAVKFQTYDVSRFIHKNEKKATIVLKNFNSHMRNFINLVFC